ncbi:putative FAD dependent oxidoreductase [Viridothelium virens]|uniref:Putative FAD dependent oxidoreductase n=1 Tax=Viridothelium virens TaxID=1048519 RepID=A0A6A6GYB0_VIRVR|nr:putative FAD dependent oxidoreductase [Viridothelium virens]
MASTYPPVKRRSIVIIGGGAIGCSIAYFLTRHTLYDREAHSVTILEASSIAAGSSGKSGGLLADWATPKCLAPLSFRTRGELAKRHGGDKIWGHRHVYCAEINLEAHELHTRGIQSSPEDMKEGFPPALDWIYSDSIKSYEEIGTPRNSAQVNSYLYTTNIAKLAEEQGAKVIIGHATRINYSPDMKSITSVTYSSHDETRDLEATDIVIAAGPWTAHIFPRAALLTPRGHSIVVIPSADLSGYVIFTNIESTPNSTVKGPISPEIYPRPPDTLHSFDTVYSSGPDDYDVPLPPSVDEVQVDDRRCEDVWNALGSVSQQIKDGQVITRQACYKPQIRQHEDNEEVGPMVGPTGITGLWLATGHDEWGMQNSAGTGLIMSEMIFEGRAHSADCESLDPKHFLNAE